MSRLLAASAATNVVRRSRTLPALKPGAGQRFIVRLEDLVLREGLAVPGASGWLARHGASAVFVSHNSRDTARSLSDKLNRIGLHIPPDRLMLAGEQAVRLVSEEQPRARCLFATSRVLQHAGRSMGLIPVQQDAHVVLLGRDINWSFARMALVANEVRRGARLVVANAERADIAPEGRLIPEAGALAAAIAHVTGRAADTVLTEPATLLLERAFVRLACLREEVVVLERDGAGAEAAIAAGWPVCSFGEGQGLEDYVEPAAAEGSPAP